MTSRSLPWIAGVVLLVEAVSARQQAPAPFRAATDLVIVPVSVRNSARPVSGLDAKDFEVSDDGVVQEVTCRAGEAIPIDVTLVLDTSGSVKGRAFEQFKESVRRISESLHFNDRVRLLTFSARVSDSTGLQPGGVPIEFNRLEVGGATSFYTALAAAVVAYPVTERPQFIFAFTDGIDNLSFQDPAGVAALVARSGAMLYVNLPGSGGSALPPSARKVLRDAIERSGGALYEGASSLPEVFAMALGDFRTSYVLSYVPTGVKGPGWHDIVVRAKSARYTVRARIGYEGE